MNKIAVNNGLFLGAALVIASALFYFVNVEWYLLYKSYPMFLIVVLLYIKTATDIKKSQNGYMAFREAFTGIMIASLIGFGICTAFEYITFNLIDPTLADQLKDISIEKMEEASALLSGDMVDDLIDTLEEENFNLTIGKSILNFGIRMLFPGIVVGAIVALITRKRIEDFA